MKIVIAPDSFKESLTAKEVAEAIKAGFETVFPNAYYDLIPMADGGEGTMQALVDTSYGRLIPCEVRNPLGEKINAYWGISGDGNTAIIEMAQASGLPLIPIEKRNPLYTTSFGTGELIKSALDYGVKHIILGIGGSATNDGGVGMLQALGVKFTDKNGQDIKMGGGELIHLAHIDLSSLDPRLLHTSIEVACDVDNPLCGKEGASCVFGRQKGADDEMIIKLDNALSHFGDIAYKILHKEIKSARGAGAAGGMGAGLLLLPQVSLRKGIDIVLNYTQLERHIVDADLVITGEGKMDRQSIFGKTPIGIAKLAKRYKKPVIAIVGSTGEGYEIVYHHGIDAIFTSIRNTKGLAYALKNAKQNISTTAENIARILEIAKYKLPHILEK